MGRRSRKTLKVRTASTHHTRQENEPLATMPAPLYSPGLDDSFLNALYNGLTEAVLATNLDARRILYWNKGAEALFGYSAQEVLGKTTEFLYPDHTSFQRIYKISVPVIREQGYWRTEWEYRRRDGSLFPAEATVTRFLRTEAGEDYIVYVIRDITERKRAEEARQRSETWLQRLIDTTQDAVISIDRQGRITLFNPSAERIFGYTQAAVQGQKLNMLMPEPYASEHSSYIERYERTREPHAISRIRTAAGRRKSGEAFPIEISVTEIKADEEVRYAAFIRDISERVRLQEQLIESERLAAISTTAAKLAHEVGNPLNGLYMTAQLLERRLAKQRDILDDKVNSIVRTLMNEITRLNLLLQEFRSLSHRQQLNLRPTNLAAVAADVLAAETPHYIACGIRVEQAIPPDLPLIIADGEKLKQVLLNLCKNAAEAMPQGGTLTVRAHSSGERVSLEVIDTGVGIPAGVNIFEPFTTTKSEGTGLGLAIVRQIVAAHGGTITYTSEPGKGTVFCLTLPLNPPSEE